MSRNERKGDNLLHELDSIRGLLDADESAFRGESVELSGRFGRSGASMDEGVSEFHLDTEGEAMDSQTPPGRQEPTLEFGDEELPEEFLRDLDTPRFKGNDPRPPASAAAEGQLDAFSHPESPPFREGQPDIPTLTESIEGGEPDLPPSWEQPPSTDSAGIPVLDDMVPPDQAEHGPTGYGAGLDVHSWEELEAIVDLLVDRRVDELRERLKQDLLAQLAHDTGLGPDQG